MTYFPRATLIIGTPGIFLLQTFDQNFHCNNSRQVKSNLPYPPFQVAIVSCDNVHTVFDDSVNQAIICVSAFMITF
jgi:hypothetical protein